MVRYRMQSDNNNTPDNQETNMPAGLATDTTISDGQLVENCQNGKLDDFGLLYDRYIRKIYDFIYFKTHHKETAEDLCSKTFMKALEKIGTCDVSKGSFSSWVYRIARNTVIDHYRTKKFTLDIDDAWDLSTGEDILKDLENKQKFEHVEKFLKTLKPEHRDLVMLRVWSGLSYKEIAQITGKSEDSCKMTFSRVISKVRKEVLLVYLLLLLTR